MKRAAKYVGICNDFRVEGHKLYLAGYRQVSRKFGIIARAKGVEPPGPFPKDRSALKEWERRWSEHRRALGESSDWIEGVPENVMGVIRALVEAERRGTLGDSVELVAVCMDASGAGSFTQGVAYIREPDFIHCREDFGIKTALIRVYDNEGKLVEVGRERFRTRIVSE